MYVRLIRHETRYSEIKSRLGATEKIYVQIYVPSPIHRFVVVYKNEIHELSLGRIANRLLWPSSNGIRMQKQSTINLLKRSMRKS